jgi:integrase
MARIRPPSIEESPKDVVAVEDMATVFKMLERDKNWRDAALLAFLYDTGMRASELADLRTVDFNIDTGVAFIPKTKTNRVRTVHLGPVGCRFVDRYWRKPRANADYVLCGPRGKLTRSGIYWAVRKVFDRAGVAGTIGAHDLRHTSASHVAASGELSESDAMALYGWSDPDMWRHYTAQAREKAALAAHAKASPLDRLVKR